MTTRFATPKGDVLAVPLAEVEYLDFITAPPARYYQNLPANHVRAWCHYRGRYGLPTQELIYWLRGQIEGKRALEIGAGSGDLGRLLGITMTDSYQQLCEPETVAYFREFNQVPTRPGPDVIKEDAETAVRKRKPQVVIASWVTEKWRGQQHGNMFGPREDYILERCEQYILIGNEAIHGQKSLLSKPHETHRFPWLVSRAKDPSKNLIYVWHNPKPLR